MIAALHVKLAVNKKLKVDHQYYRNFYYNVSTFEPTVYQQYLWQPAESEMNYCNIESLTFNHDCDSYVVSAVKVSDSEYSICASSAKKPRCRKLIQSDDVSVFYGYEKLCIACNISLIYCHCK